MRKHAAWILIVCSLLTALPGAGVSAMESAEPPASGGAASGGAVSAETAAARCAADFIAMVNAGTPEASRAFEQKWASKGRLAKAGLDERAGRAASLKSEFAPAKVVKVVSSSEGAAVLRVSISGGREAQMTFEMESGEPGKLSTVLIEAGGPVDSRPVTEEARQEVVRGAARILTTYYVYPEVAEKMAEAVLAKLEAGAYDSCADEAALARKLTEDLRAVSHDLHLRVALSPESEGGDRGHVGMPPAEEMRRENYAFKKVEVLPGNIGYLRFDLFMDDPEAKKTAAAALAFLGNCDALIFDVRANGGGSPEMIRFLTSHLFSKRTHLNDMVDRDGNVVEEFWTVEDAPGPRFADDLPVYVLTSKRTFSGAEEFTYNLRNLERATVVGETTGGGAHPVRPERINGRFVVGVPYMRARNPISGTNWEGTGVEPHIEVPAELALDKAIGEATKEVEARRAAAKR